MNFSSKVAERISPASRILVLVLLWSLTTAGLARAGEDTGLRGDPAAIADAEAMVEEMDRDAELVLYCRSGARSDRAVRFLLRQGYPQVYNLKGGISAWGKAGLPLQYK